MPLTKTATDASNNTTTMSLIPPELTADVCMIEIADEIVHMF